MAESVMIHLTGQGMGRQDAHEHVREASMKALAEKRALADVLADDPKVLKFCTRNDIVKLLDPDNYIGTAPQQAGRVIRKLRPLVK
jgi:adenylosuccinate lyase